MPCGTCHIVQTQYMHTFYVCIYIYIHTYVHIHTYMCISGLGSRAATPPPPWYPPPLPPGTRPLLPATTGTNPRKPEGGRTENDPSQCFFTGAENRIRAGTAAPFARRKEQHHILYGNEHVTMTLLLTDGSSHTISL